MTRSELKTAFHDFMAANLKPGDIIHNAGGNPVKIKRVNRKSLTMETGTSYSYGEVTPSNEIIDAFRAWVYRHEPRD